MQENKNIEFKREYTENIYKEIVASLNSYSSMIFIGYDDDGTLIGLINSKEIKERISNEITGKITPDCSIFVSINNCSLEDKQYITLKSLREI